MRYLIQINTKMNNTDCCDHFCQLFVTHTFAIFQFARSEAFLLTQSSSNVVQMTVELAEKNKRKDVFYGKKGRKRVF